MNRPDQQLIEKLKRTLLPEFAAHEYAEFDHDKPIDGTVLEDASDFDSSPQEDLTSIPTGEMAEKEQIANPPVNEKD